ncbi:MULTISPECIES: DUF4198 domain-containing protein [unclassified Desulfovibrio]|uniref:DUF4198 domain-containing protein n=1 Tax=unclassified Desulfovibrio TaxID=2593640 RepID=UPI0013EC7F70|nr:MULTISPECIES: DUF4198 domain-containing protein [unclassified Desulfovibrio]
MRIPRLAPALAALVFLLAHAGPAGAHFGMVIPSAPTVTERAAADLTLDIAFAHPQERKSMVMEKPRAFQVFRDGKAEDLIGTLKEVKFLDHKAWQAKYRIARPGVYQFAVEPEPYFEPAENCYIIHYAKTVVAAFGAEEGWAEPLGLKTEIVPLTRPFANYAGNVFAGRVLLDGKPVPGAEVEVEFWNRDGRHEAPDVYYVTQVVRADENGVFVYGVPWAGWWGFAALNEGGERPGPDNKPVQVELGAVLWVDFVAPITH